MNKVDLKSLRTGDTVLIRGVVMGEIRSTTTGDRVNVSISGYAYGAHTSDIVSVEPRPLAVGDKVRVTDGGDWSGEVRGIDDRFAWVRWTDGDCNYGSWPLANLQRA